MGRPEVADLLALKPYKVYTSEKKLERIYQEWLSADAAWSLQVWPLSFTTLDLSLNATSTFQEKLPDGATLLGVVLGMDKTNISVMTGGTMVRPLYLSLANLPMEYRLKASNNAYVLLALVPIPVYPDKLQHVASVLENRLVHKALDMILLPLKYAAVFGRLMSDPRGSSRLCFTLLASCVVDTPEAGLLSGVKGMTSHLTMAFHKEFGDSTRHPPRTREKTMRMLQKVGKTYKPWAQIDQYVIAAKNVRLNGVHKLFWRDWHLAEPSVFFTPELLHHSHKMFGDHDRKWCSNAVGSQEINFRYSVLQQHTGFRHFHKGVTGLRQATCREHKDMQRYIVAVIAGAVSESFVIAIRSLITFRYLSQAPEVSETLLKEMRSALETFHKHKHAIIEARARRGEKGVAIEHWNIPKLELMHSVVPSIQQTGVPMQWTAEVTERAHKDKIKEPSRSSNHREYESQICRASDRLDKINNFDLAIAIRDLKMAELVQEEEEEEDEPDSDPEDGEGEHQALQNGSKEKRRSRSPNPREPSKQSLDYFALATKLSAAYEKTREAGFRSSICLPLRTFSIPSTSFHLSRDPRWKRRTISDIVQQFRLPDLEPALKEYVRRLHVWGSQADKELVVGGRRHTYKDKELPFTELDVWKSFRIQKREYFAPYRPLPARTIHALPPGEDEAWPHGRYEAGIVNHDDTQTWPESGLNGEFSLVN